MAISTMFGSSYASHSDLFSSNVRICCISSSVSSKSKMSIFSSMRSLCEDFGITTIPRCTLKRRMTCAGVLPYFLAMAMSIGVRNSWIRRCSASGPHASCCMPSFRIHPYNASYWKNGCVSTWFTAGFTSLKAVRSAIRSAEKLLMPMARKYPSLYKSSNA